MNANLWDMAHSFVQQNVKLMSTWHMRSLYILMFNLWKCLVDMLILSFMKQNNDNNNKMTTNDWMYIELLAWHYCKL
jgi:hypothetical protein